MDPLPSTEIFAPVSSCKRLIVLPCGPRILPTKLNWWEKWEVNSTSPCIVQTNSDSARWLTRGYCFTGMSTRSFTLTFLAVNRSRYVSDSFLGSPFCTLSISVRENTKSAHSKKKKSFIFALPHLFWKLQTFQQVTENSLPNATRNELRNVLCYMHFDLSAIANVIR